MAEDYFVKSRSLEECERIADFWRAKFQVRGNMSRRLFRYFRPAPNCCRA